MSEKVRFFQGAGRPTRWHPLCSFVIALKRKQVDASGTSLERASQNEIPIAVGGKVICILERLGQAPAILLRAIANRREIQLEARRIAFSRNLKASATSLVTLEILYSRPEFRQTVYLREPLGLALLSQRGHR
jgi:hypothetical protein